VPLALGRARSSLHFYLRLRELTDWTASAPNSVVQRLQSPFWKMRPIMEYFVCSFHHNLTSGDIERSGCKRKRPASLIWPSATRQQSFAVSSLSQAPKMNGLCPKNNLEGLYMKLLQTPVRRPLPTRLSGCQFAAVCGCARSSARRSRNPNHA
jgi:hypothetical protein